MHRQDVAVHGERVSRQVEHAFIALPGTFGADHEHVRDEQEGVLVFVALAVAIPNRRRAVEADRSHLQLVDVVAWTQAEALRQREYLWRRGNRESLRNARSHAEGAGAGLFIEDPGAGELRKRARGIWRPLRGGAFE